MRSKQYSRDGIQRAALLLLCLLLAFSPSAYAAGSTLSSDFLLSKLEADCAERLNVDVTLSLLQPLPAVQTSGGAVEISARYPQRAGQWLPDALVVREDGRQTASIPLYPYVEFSLPVLVAPNGLAARTVIQPQQLGTAVLKLRAGREVLCDSASASGCETRLALHPGAQLLFSALRAPYDVRRGDELTLVLRLPGMEVKASATALSDAYIGQRVTVRRTADRKQFSGLLASGSLVVVE